MVYTEEKWQLLVPINIQYTGHLGLHQKVIVGVTEFRLSQVAYDFNTQISKADQTIEKLMTDQSACIADWQTPVGKANDRHRSVFFSFYQPWPVNGLWTKQLDSCEWLTN